MELAPSSVQWRVKDPLARARMTVLLDEFSHEIMMMMMPLSLKHWDRGLMTSVSVSKRASTGKASPPGIYGCSF